MTLKSQRHGQQLNPARVLRASSIDRRAWPVRARTSAARPEPRRAGARGARSSMVLDSKINADTPGDLFGYGIPADTFVGAVSDTGRSLSRVTRAPPPTSNNYAKPCSVASSS